MIGWLSMSLFMVAFWGVVIYLATHHPYRYPPEIQRSRDLRHAKLRGRRRS